MNPLIQLKTTIPSIFIASVLACLGLSSKARAVVPAPDGGYPGGNTAEGQAALFSLTSGTFNTAVGLFSLRSNTTGSENTAIGAGALLLNTESQNTATGAGALLSNTTGTANVAAGVHALFNNTTGFENTATGGEALLSNTGGNQNTAIGFWALRNSTFSRNIAIGSLAGTGVTTASDVICIGAPGLNESNRCFIGQIFNTDLTGGNAVFINSDGKLGLIISSQRFKEEIKPMERSSEVLYALKPVTFRYKKAIDPQGIPQFGLVAEEVEKVNPDLVVRDKEGKPRGVRYDQVNAMLLNEFLKEHKKVEQQQATIVELKSTVAQQRKDFEAATAQQHEQIEALAASVKEQAAQIQRVSVQIELNRPATQQVALKIP
jgi:Chaperone of endosialidase